MDWFVTGYTRQYVTTIWNKHFNQESCLPCCLAVRSWLINKFFIRSALKLRVKFFFIPCRPYNIIATTTQLFYFFCIKTNSVNMWLWCKEEIKIYITSKTSDILLWGLLIRRYYWFDSFNFLLNCSTVYIVAIKYLVTVELWYCKHQ